MAIFEKSFAAAVSFDRNVKAAQEAFNQAMEEAKNLYSSAVYVDKRKAAKEILDRTAEEERMKAVDIFNVDFADVRKQLNNMISDAPSEDFTAIVAAVQARGENLTDHECEAYLNKFADNYTAFCALVELFHAAKKAKDIIPVNAETIHEEVDILEKYVFNWIRTYGDGSGYLTALFTDENQSPIKKTGAMLQRYIDGGFRDGNLMR